MRLIMRSKLVEKLKVVVDTNNVVSAPFSEHGNPARIFELILIQEITNFTSDKIIEEITDVLNRDKFKRILSKDKIKFIIKNFKKFSILVNPNFKLDIIKEDADDNIILECAVTANAEYIISGDNHLLNLGHYKNSKIVSPKQFLDIYLEHIKKLQ